MRSADKALARLAVDIGGTFTDVALETVAGALVTTKTLTTQAAPEEGVMKAAAEALAKASLSPADIGVIIHGTTLATNALIEKRGAKTALLTTEGHRDSLEMAYENRFEQYDINIDRPPPLVPRWLRLPVRERMNAKGEALIPLDEASVKALLPALDEEAVESVAVGFLHSYANPAHERRVAEIIGAARPKLSLSLSSEVAPEIREYERQTTTVANAYVRPLMERYLRALEKQFRDKGFACPFLLVTSGGGLATVETAAKFPIRLVESGPAGGAVLAASLARRLDLPELLSFDMGGTTAKMCLIDDFEPRAARAFEVDRSYRFKKGSGLPIRIPVIELVEIGAGGGSIAKVDALKRIAVGPESAGAEPGPACYGRGGSAPTVTDADLAAGRLAPDSFAGGSMRLDEKAATEALSRDVAAPLGLDAQGAAFAVGETVDENMAQAARAHAVEQGKDIRKRTMIAFGGAAPLHAARLAEKLGLERVIVPEGAGVGSAIGFLLTPAAYEIVRSLPMKLDALDAARIEALFGELRAEAESVVRAAAPDTPLAETRAAYMRYRGQGYEIAVPVTVIPENGEAVYPGPRPARALTRREVPDRQEACRRAGHSPDPGAASGMTGALRAAFEKEYRALYGRTIPGMGIEILSWSLRIAAPAPEPARVDAPKKTRALKAERRRDVFDAAAERRLAYAIFRRDNLSPGNRIEGPALIVEPQTTTVVTSGFDAAIDGARNIVLTRKNAA